MRAQWGRWWGVAAVATAATVLLAGSPEEPAGRIAPAPVAAPSSAAAPAPSPPAVPAPAATAARAPSAPVARAPARVPSCSAEPDPADAAAVAAMVDSLRRLPPRRTPDGEEVVTLDNRGFGYGGSPGPFALSPAARRR